MKAAWAALIAILAVAGAARADDYPSRPITIIIPFAAGGPSDAMARVLAERMRASLGQPLVIENVTGAVGSIGGGAAVHSAPAGRRRGRGVGQPHRRRLFRERLRDQAAIRAVSRHRARPERSDRRPDR